MRWKKLLGPFAYLSGIALGIAEPPVERLACMTLPGGEVRTAINTSQLLIELALVMFGALLIGLERDFNNDHELNGWLGASTGTGMVIIGSYSQIDGLSLLGAALATLGMLVYAMGRVRDADGRGFEP